MKRIALVVPLALFPILAQQTVPPQPDRQPRFVLADVHVSPTAYWFAQNTSSLGETRPGLIMDGVYIYRDASLLSLIEAAYGVTEDMVSGGPGWLKSELFDVFAKVPEGTTPTNLKLMLQSLLADRFAMVVQAEPRPTPRYVLSVAKGGSKLKRAASPAGDSGCTRERLAATATSQDGQLPVRNFKSSCHNMKSQEIAAMLKQIAGGYTTYLDHDIIDSTNLEGAWDFDIEWTPPLSAGGKGSGTITIFEAVNKLGLTLELQQVPLPVVVVKSVNRKPSPNPPEVATGLVIPPARFEAAIIKPLEPGPRVFTGASGGGQYKTVGTLRSLMAAALQIQTNAAADKIVGLPKFADSQVWDVTAKYPSTGEGAPVVTAGRTVPPTLSLLLKMLQDLLAEQFELKMHPENREITVYALTVDGKPKLNKADPSERSDCRPDPNVPKPIPGLGIMVDCKNTSMAELARNLEQATGYFDHPIVDETGLEGGWDFVVGMNDLRVQSRRLAANQQGGNVQGGLPDAPEGITSYEAVQKQLGLKLVKTKRSVPVIVVDHVDEKPIN